ncbi:hypothetical protein BH09BAC6_BH09BAC6_16560 [soil metagenome]
MGNFAVVILFTCLVLASCNQTGTYNPTSKNQRDTGGRALSKIDSLKSLRSKPPTYNKRDLQLFCNTEITPYCVLLPLQEFKEDFNNPSFIKAKHKFVLKNDTAAFSSIEVQAFTIDKKNNYNTKLFYQRDKNDVEQGGLGIDTSYIDEVKHFYLIKGYLPNYMNMRFVQVNWILKDRIAIYFNYYDKDEALWMDWINAIISRGVVHSD